MVRHPVPDVFKLYVGNLMFILNVLGRECRRVFGGFYH